MRRLLRFLREVSGESAWDDYVAKCREEGREPASRREFERHRAEHREHDVRSRCC